MQSTKQRMIELFEYRDKQFFNATENLFSRIPHVLEAIQEVIGDEVAQFLDWKNIELIEGKLYIVGLVEYPFGYAITIKETNETIIIDKENQEQFHNIIKVGLPLDLAMKSSTDFLAKYLGDRNGMKQSEDMQDIGPVEMGTSDATWVDEGTLTEEQRLNLITYTDKTKIN